MFLMGVLVSITDCDQIWQGVQSGLRCWQVVVAGRGRSWQVVVAGRGRSWSQVVAGRGTLALAGRGRRLLNVTVTRRPMLLFFQ